MSKYLYIIDYGHGGVIDGKYQTAGKRSPKFNDRSFPNGKPFVLYEGVSNRVNAKMLMNALNRLNIDNVDIVNSDKDISLRERVRRANELNRKRKCIYGNENQQKEQRREKAEKRERRRNKQQDVSGQRSFL